MKKVINQVVVGETIQLVEGQKFRVVSKIVKLNACTLMVTFADGFWIKLDVNKTVEVF